MWWCRLELARAYAHCVSSAWGPLLECVFALADLQALPASLTDVDDFGDAQGNPLPPSVFAKRCRDRARYGETKADWWFVDGLTGERLGGRECNPSSDFVPRLN